jgi:hypothetical protein
MLRQQRVATAAPEPAKTEGGLHHGKRHAETEELAKARAESAQHLPQSPVSLTTCRLPNTRASCELLPFSALDRFVKVPRRPCL